ncbi:MAG: TraR/DksA C4-type zinc finger protein [Puniceicoccales bacterium]|jgi:RNA polymerase-binding transcription factor DksA|nr:TraR/DksA C4-type zinc finger protein [Puniceicoccales bacterium]
MATTQKEQAGTFFTLEDMRQALSERADGATTQQVTAATAAVPTKRRASVPTETKQRKVERPAASVLDILGFDPHAMADGADGSDLDRVPSKWRSHCDALLRIRDELTRRLRRHAEETLLQGDSSAGESGSGGGGKGGVDGALEQVELERALSFVENEQELLREVEAALERLVRGTYGVCEQTGEPIAAERLAALPFARYSRRGQEEYERNRRRTVSTGQGPLFAPLDDGDDAPMDGAAEDGVP